jgi:hypothetical protein
MPRYGVTLSAVGSTYVELEADNQDAAVDRALRESHGYIVEGGSIGWDVEHVTELGEAGQ